MTASDAPKKKTAKAKKNISYEEYLKDNSQTFLFDKDILDMNYEYWETPEEKEERLRIKWIESKQKYLSNLEMTNKIVEEESIKLPKSSVEADKNIQELSNELCKMIRDLRMKIDQNLIKLNKHPLFSSNYKYYSGDEFMIDTDHEFYKIKKFLQNDKENIIKDPEIGHRYNELLETLKRKKVLENTYVEHYNERAYHQLDRGDIFENEEDDEKATEESVKSFNAYSEKFNAKYSTEKISTEDLVAAKDTKKVEDKLGKYKEKILASFESALGAVQPKKGTKKSGVIQPTDTKPPRINNAKKRPVK